MASATARAALTSLLVFGLVAAAAPAEQPTAAAKRLGPGCDRSRPAVAHYAGAARGPRRSARPPVPCLTFVGQSAETALIGITRSGSIFYAPRIDNSSPPPGNVLQGPEYVVRSRNLGATWTRLPSGGPTTGGLVPPWMHVDPQTSRVWFLTTLPGLCGARISWSDDEGRHWRTNPSVGCPGQGSERVLEGPPPRGGAKPVGYRHVVYYCGNGVDYTASIVYCYRSLDGGRTFAPTGGTPDPPGTPGACGVNHAARRARSDPTARSTSRSTCAGSSGSRSAGTRAPPGTAGRWPTRTSRTCTSRRPRRMRRATST